MDGLIRLLSSKQQVLEESIEKSPSKVERLQLTTKAGNLLQITLLLLYKWLSFSLTQFIDTTLRNADPRVLCHDKFNHDFILPFEGLDCFFMRTCFTILGYGFSLLVLGIHVASITNAVG